LQDASAYDKLIETTESLRRKAFLLSLPAALQKDTWWFPFLRPEQGISQSI